MATMTRFGGVSNGPRGEISTGGLEGRPTYKEPEYDWHKLRELQQEEMAPELATMGRGLEDIYTRGDSNPMERAEAMRGGMRGMGEGLGQIQAGGMQSALAMYQPQWESALTKSKIDYNTALGQWQAKEEERMKGEAEKKVAIGRVSDLYPTGTTFFNRVTGQYEPGTGPNPNMPTGTSYVKAPSGLPNVGFTEAEKPWYQQQQEAYEKGGSAAPTATRRGVGWSY